MEKEEFIVKVMLNHPFAGDDDIHIKEAKKQIKDRYRKIKGEKGFTGGEIEAKTEWLRSFLSCGVH